MRSRAKHRNPPILNMKIAFLIFFLFGVGPKLGYSETCDGPLCGEIPTITPIPGTIPSKLESPCCKDDSCAVLTEAALKVMHEYEKWTADWYIQVIPKVTTILVAGFFSKTLCLVIQPMIRDGDNPEICTDMGVLVSGSVSLIFSTVEANGIKWEMNKFRALAQGFRDEFGRLAMQWPQDTANDEL